MSSPLIPFAKLQEAAVLRVIQGFCTAEPVAEISAEAGISAKTCRSIVLALRPRLLESRFDPWRDVGFMRAILDPELEETAMRVVLGCLADCYGNRNCYTNFQQGRRKSRLCRSCRIPALEMGADYDAAALYHIDLIHGFYAVLGIGGERRVDPVTLFRLRLSHMQIVGEAFEQTRRLDDDAPDFTDPAPRAVHALYDQIIRSLQARPLVRGEV
ncbi:MAG: hypothetical protein QNJ84_10660 [Alphaproteobacteria bacterium]|nr:hypothetical protein [Alphaproteobacteria bacterium]